MISRGDRQGPSKANAKKQKQRQKQAGLAELYRVLQCAESGALQCDAESKFRLRSGGGGGRRESAQCSAVQSVQWWACAIVRVGANAT